MKDCRKANGENENDNAITDLKKIPNCFKVYNVFNLNTIVLPQSLRLEVCAGLSSVMPLPPTPEKTLTNPACSIKMLVQFLMFPKGILTNPAHSHRKLDQSSHVQKQFWLLLLASEGILTNIHTPTEWYINPAHSRKNLDSSCLPLKKFWLIPPTLKEWGSLVLPERWTKAPTPADIYFFHVPILCMFKWTYLLGYNFPKYKPISNLNPSNPDQDKAFPEYKWMNVEWIYAQDKLSSRCPYHIPSQTCTHDCKFNHNIRQATLTTPLFELKLSMAVI